MRLSFDLYFRMAVKDWKKMANSTPAYQIVNRTLRFQTKFVIAITLLGLAALIFTRSGYRRDASRHPKSSTDDTYYYDQDYNRTYPLSPPKALSKYGLEFHIGLVADLDLNSRCNRSGGEGDTGKCWLSYFLKGKLMWHPSNNVAAVYWEQKPSILKSSYSLAGRGMELSELITFDGRLLTLDDRTGIVYRIRDHQSEAAAVVPWILLTDGDGNINKGKNDTWLSNEIFRPAMHFSYFAFCVCFCETPQNTKHSLYTFRISFKFRFR